MSSFFINLTRRPTINFTSSFRVFTLTPNLYSERDDSASNIGALVIVHDLDIAPFYCDKILLLDGGRLIAHDASKSSDEDPNAGARLSLLGDASLIDANEKAAIQKRFLS